jgi:MFS family permease
VAAGFLVGGLVWEATAWPLRLAGGSSLLMAIFCFFLPATPPPQSRDVGLGSLLSSEAKALLRNRAFIIFMVGLTLTRIPASFYYSFVNPYLFDAGIANPTGKMSLGQVVEIFLMLSFPFAFRHLGLKRMFLLGMTAWGLRYLLFAYAGGNTAMIYTAILLHGICYNYTSLVGQIYVDQTVPVHLRSTAQGFITFISMGFGALVGSYLAGFVVESYTTPDLSRDWTSIFLVPGVVGVATVIWFAVAFRPKSRWG